MDFFIGTPLILILFVIYYGLPQSGIHLSSFTVAVTGFTLNVGAYNAAYMTTAYNALNKYETEAAVVQGLNKRQVFFVDYTASGIVVFHSSLNESDD